MSQLLSGAFGALLVFGVLTVPMIVHSEETVLADFGGGADVASWTIVNDTVMGGRSSSQFSIEDGSLSFSGTLNTNGGGFASVRGVPMNTATTEQCLVRLRVKGDGRNYQLRLTSAASATTYRAIFPTQEEWRVVEIPLARFEATWRGRRLDRPPLRADDIGGLGILLADRKDGAFAVSVSRIVLTACEEATP